MVDIFAQRSAVLRARRHLLPDIAALGEIDGMQHVIAPFEQQGALGNQILRTVGNAERQAVGIVTGFKRLQRHGRESAPAEVKVARVAV